jgi:hypothetical protein
MGETSGSEPSPAPDRNGFVGGERPRSRWFPWIGDERGHPATDPREEPKTGHAATAGGQRPQQCGTAVDEGKSSKGVNRCARNARVSRTTSRWSRGPDAGNARNPRAGSGVQQTRSRRAEETAEVVKNHEGGTRCRWLAPSAQRRPRPPGVDARRVKRQRGTKAGIPRTLASRPPRRLRRPPAIARALGRRSEDHEGRPRGQRGAACAARSGLRRRKVREHPESQLETAKAVGGAGKTNDLLPTHPQRTTQCPTGNAPRHPEGHALPAPTVPPRQDGISPSHGSVRMLPWSSRPHIDRGYVLGGYPCRRVS